MLFYEMPAARTNQQCSDLFIERVLLSLRTVVRYGAIDRVADVDLPLNRTLPCWGKGILKVSHEDFRTGIQSVNYHFSFNRTGNLHTPILKVRRHRRDGPFTIANMFSFRQEIGQLA